MKDWQRGLGDMLCPPLPVSPAANQVGISSSQPKIPALPQLCSAGFRTPQREGRVGACHCQNAVDWPLRHPSAARSDFP